MGKSSKLPCHSLGKSANLTHDKTFLTVSNRFVSSLDSPSVILNQKGFSCMEEKIKRKFVKESQ